MASPAKTSSSSSIPYRTNPNMKRSELCYPMRRSFGGNPFTMPSVMTNPGAFNPSTPANSPSDFPRRYSTGRGSVASLRDPDKENSRDQNPKPTRVRSPALSNGTKNFMSPTISAASKINASPRKKILVERNEPVRSSVSFSDVKSLVMEDSESTPEIALKQKKVSFSDVESVIMEDESTPEIGLNQKKVSFSDVKSIVMEDNELTPQIGLKQKNVEVPNDSESSSHEHEEPLKSNADFDYKESKNDSVCEEPLMLPYDPKTNFLSPRPQFLHYRPNPRIELYREREGKQLEENFASESYSDIDVTDETQSEGSQRESEDISSEETMKEGEEEEEEEEELYVSEPNPIAPDMVEMKFEAKRMSKPRFSTGSKFIALLLFLGFAYFSVLVANSPAFTPGLEELSLSSFEISTEVTDFAKANFDRFTQYLQQWSASFLSYVSNIISSLREVHKVDIFQYDNFSYMMEDHRSQRHLMFDHSILEPVRERDSGTEQFNDKYHGEIEADESVDEDDEQENEACEHLEPVSEEETEVEMIEYLEEETKVEIDAEHQSNVELRDQPSIISQATEIQHDISKTGGDPEGDDLNIVPETVFLEEELKSDNLNIEDSTDNTRSSEHLEEETNAEIDAEHQSNVELRDQPSIISQATEIQHDKSKTGGDQGDDLNIVPETVFLEEELKSDNLNIEDSTDNTRSSEHLEEETKAEIDAEHQSNVELRDQPSIISQATEIQHDISKTGGDPEGDDLNIVPETVFLEEELKSDNLNIEDSTDNTRSSEVVDSIIIGQEDQFLAKNVKGFSLLVLCLFAASAFIYTKRGMPSMPNVPVEQALLSKKSECSPLSGSKDTIRERLSSRNWQTEVDMTNESWPSEISSCRRTSSSYSKKGGLKESNEYQSQERKTRKTYRRESLASSDYSYGSFTTYEKITSKHVGEDEEIVTPVRRSSRIRNQVTCP